MRVIIAGGRDYKFTVKDRKWINSIHNNWRIIEVISGMASGADMEGLEWAQSIGIPIKEFYAKWDDLDAPNAIIKTGKNRIIYNANAGFDRNILMAKYAKDRAPSSLIVFPGNNGTQHMIKTANLYGIPVVIAPSWY